MLLDNYIYVSFDVFDTLIKRNVIIPKDIFRVVQERYNKFYDTLEDFQYQRILVEKTLRKSKDREISLSEIYNKLASIYGHDVSMKLMDLECQVEIDLCCPNLEIKEIYDTCIKEGKKILIITDMYLDRKTIRTMLEKCGYLKYDKLYISSEIGKTKESGKLYKVIKQELQINGDRWIHIGDNKKSDYNQAIKNGINAKLIKTFYNRLRYINVKQIKSISESRVNATLNNFVEKDFEYYRRLGYESFGPILVGFVNWLAKELKKEKINKVYFLSRDGYIIKNVYDLIKGENINSQYLYVSRRSLQVPAFYVNSDYESVIDSFFLPRTIKFSTFIKKIGLTYSEISKIAEDYSLKEDTIIECKNIKSNQNLRDFYNDIKNIIVENAEKEYIALVKYLKQNDFEGKVAIVDIGWFGNMQAALNKIIKHESLNAEIYGYYIGLIPEGPLQKEQKMKGYLFSANHNQDLHLKEKIFNSIFETIFLARHGSVNRYSLVDNVAQVELFPYECRDKLMEESINELQDGALIFAKHWYSVPYADEIDINPRFVFNTISNIGITPDIESAERLGGWKFFDIEECFIAKPDNLRNYMLKPKKFLKDLNAAPWKVGFLKRTFKINLPYYNIWMFIRNVYKRCN